MEPRDRAAPRTEAELAQLVVRSRKLRVAGAGHSFMPLCETDGTLVDLSALEDQVQIASDATCAWVPAGWSLRKLAPALWDKGFSLVNQGDVDPQSVAGALATGTHGTGAELGSLSTAARAFRLMLADGSIVECSADERPELYEAQRLSLGLLGIALRVRLDVLPAYRLEERIWPMRFDEAHERFDELAAQYRHVEFLLFPYSDRVILKTLHPTGDARPTRPLSAAEELAFKLCCDVTAAAPSAASLTQRLLMKFVRGSRRVGPAHRIFATDRHVRFEEMEYELPRAAGFPALREAVNWIRRGEHPVAFPFEFRWTAADDIWLSPFNRGPCASVSLHQYAKMPWRDLFLSAEPIFRAYGGRPHWAKRHTLSAEDVATLYPESARFRRVRTEVDPEAKFANRLTAELFQIEPSARSLEHAG